MVFSRFYKEDNNIEEVLNDRFICNRLRGEVSNSMFIFCSVKSSDERYANKRCTNALTLVANKYGFTYAKAKNDKDAFDALYDNGRKGWTDRPLERGVSGFIMYEKYKDLSLDEIEKAAEKIIEEAEDIGKPYFSIKTKDADTVNAILSKPVI